MFIVSNKICFLRFIQKIFDYFSNPVKLSTTPFSTCFVCFIAHKTFVINILLLYKLLICSTYMSVFFKFHFDKIIVISISIHTNT